MSRTNGEGRTKKRNCCLTCSIVCFVLLVVFLVALYVGGTILFKQYVSPHIGGLELNDAIALATNVLSGKEAKTTYTEDDLDSFYSGLSDAMFLSDKTENELEYELVPDDKKATLAPDSAVAAAEEEGSSETAEYDEDAAYDAFCLLPASERYALLTDETRALLTLAEYSALAASTDEAKAAREKVGLKTYRLSIDALMKDMDFGAEDFDAGKAMEKSLSSLEFNFDSLEDYDIYNEFASQNEKFTTFSVNGNQASAFINDIISYLLAAENSPLTSMLKDSLPVEIPLADYVKVASVTIMNTPLAVKEGEAIYDQKDTALGISICLHLRDLVKAALATDELKKQLDGVPDFAVNIIPSLVPQFFSANVTVFPLAPQEDDREIIVTINKPSQKNAERLAILLNALLGDGEDASRSFFTTINDKISETFTSINDTVKINFIPSKDAENKPLKDENGNTYSEMQIMTWQTVLSMIDEEGRLSAHDVLTMLKCLYISKGVHTEIETDTAMNAFKTDMADKYGVEKAYLDENNIFSGDALSGMAEHIDIGGIELKEDNAAMRVRLSAEALAAFMTDFISDEDDSTAAAEEDEDSSSSLLEGLELTITDVTIDLVSDEGGVKVFSFELGILVDLDKLLDDKLPSEGIEGTLSRKLLPKNDAYLCVKMYISEYTDAENGHLTHKVGKNIDSPAEGETSAYLSKIRINDFSYADTERVFDALDNFMQVLSGDSFNVNSITGDIEDSVNDFFESLTDSDYNVDLHLYKKDDEGGRGGMTLPSVYELLTSVVEPKLDAEKGETFGLADARAVLMQIYQNDDVDDAVYYTAAQADDFMDEVNDKYYIKKASALSVSDLFGDTASGLSSKIDSTSIYFKPDAVEAALWDGTKISLYADTRSVTSLRIRLSGTIVAALVEESKMIPDDIAADFGTVEVLGAKFETTEQKTFLTFDMKLVKKEDDGDLKFGKAFPDDIKLSAKILLHAPSYSEEEPRYSTKIVINDAASEKAFILLRALGGEELSEQAIADKISESIATTFNTLEGTIPLYYTDEEDGNKPYLMAGEGSEECILISDVFSFLIKETDMKDVDKPAEAASAEVKQAYLNAPNTDPQQLANRLRGFGQQASGDAANESDYDWAIRIDPFVYSDDENDDNDSDAYIYKNMKDAYFMKNEMTLNEIYGEGAFNDQFGEIRTEDFNLKDNENGLFYYDGDKKTLKISDKALGVIVKKKQDFSSAVAGAGMTPEIVSLKLYSEAGNLVIESGVKIAFAQTGEHSADYVSMPAYFFVISKTVRSWDDGEGKFVFTTTLTMNNLETDATDKLFFNIRSLENKGIKADSFNKEDITGTINSRIEDAFTNLPSNVSFGSFTSADISSTYQTSTELAPTVYPDGCILPEEGDGYLSFPSIYSYLLDIFYPEAEGGWPAYDDPEAKLQHMLLSLHAADASTAVITNEKNNLAYHVDIGQGFTSSSIDDAIVIYSDQYLAYVLNGLLSSQTLNSDISMNDALKQTIILSAIGSTDDPGERATWADKFYTLIDPFVYNKNYIIATVVVSLDGYSTGNADLLPAGNTMCFTVLVDLATPDNSVGLLYDMDYDDMAIFEHIIKNNNASFDINEIARELAGKIKDHMDGFKVSGEQAELTYHLTGDTFMYSEVMVPFNANKDAGTLNNGSGIGYVVLSKATA